MLHERLLGLALCASLATRPYVHGVAVETVVLGPSNAEEWKVYYGELLTTAGTIDIAGYTSIGGYEELFDVIESELTVPVNYLAGNGNFTSINNYAEACAAACEENRITCGSFAYSYLESTPANNACLLMNKSDLFTLVGFQCDGFCPASEDAVMMQILIQSPAPTCGVDRYYGYEVAAELATEIFNLGCQDIIENGGTCGDIGYAGFDLTNDNEGCAVDSVCFYVKEDGASRCLTREAVDVIIREELAAEQEKQRQKAELLNSYRDMLLNVSVPQYMVPYWTVMAIANLDDSSYRPDGEFVNYNQSLEYLPLSGIGELTVGEYANACAVACDELNSTASEACKGFGYVYKPDTIAENQCRLFPQSVEFNFLGYGCGDSYCAPGNGIMLKLYFKEEVDCGEGMFNGYDLQHFSYEGDRLENYVCRNQWEINGYCGADAFTPSNDLSYNNSGCPLVTECEQDDASGYFYCRLGDTLPTLEGGTIDGMEYNVYIGELSSITGVDDDTLSEEVDESTYETLPARFQWCTEQCAANRPCQSWALLSDFKTCFMTNYHVTQLPEQNIDDLSTGNLETQAILGYFIEVRKDPIVLTVPAQDNGSIILTTLAGTASGVPIEPPATTSAADPTGPATTTIDLFSIQQPKETQIDVITTTSGVSETDTSTVASTERITSTSTVIITSTTLITSTSAESTVNAIDPSSTVIAASANTLVTTTDELSEAQTTTASQNGTSISLTP